MTKDLQNLMHILSASHDWQNVQLSNFSDDLDMQYVAHSEKIVHEFFLKYSAKNNFKVNG